MAESQADRPIPVRMPEALVRAANVRAAELGITRSELVRAALAEAVNRPVEDARRAVEANAGN